MGVWQRSPFLTKIFSKTFILLPFYGQHTTDSATLLRGETLQHKKDGIAMKKQLAESIILNLLSFTADQMKAFLSHEDVAGKLDASLLAQLCQSPEDLLQKDQ